MGLDDVSLLANNAAAAAPAAEGANGAAAPSQPTPPPEDKLQSGSFSERMAHAAAQLGIPPGPDGWAKSLVGGAMIALGGPAKPPAETPRSEWNAPLAGGTQDRTPDTQEVKQPEQPNKALQAVHGISGILADAAGGMKVAGGHGGALAGVAGAAEAHEERTARDENARQLTAKANAELLHQQRLIHALDTDSMDKGADSGTKALEAIESAPSPGVTTYRGQTSDQLHTLLSQGKIDPTTQTVFHTGNVQDGTDANGVPHYRATYSVVQLGGPVTLDKEQADYMNKYLHPSSPIKEGQQLDSAVFNSMYQTASSAQTTQDALEQSRKKKNVENAKLDNESEYYSLTKNPTVTNALGTAYRDGQDPAYAAIRASDALHKNPEFMQEHPTFTGKELVGNQEYWDKLNHDYRETLQKNNEGIDGFAKDPKSIEGHTSAAISSANSIIGDPSQSADAKAAAQRVLTIANNTRQLEIDLEGAKALKKDEVKQNREKNSNPNGLQGEEFINSLPVGRQGALRAFGNGTLTVNPTALERTDKGQALMDDIYAAYPDFKADKSAQWPKTYHEFTSPSAKTGNGLLRSNTAIRHAQELLDVTTFDGVFNPTSKAYQDRKAIIGRFSDEINAAIKGGVVGQEEGHEALKAIQGSLLDSPTIGARRERVMKTTKLLMDRIEENQAAYDREKPSQLVGTAPLVSPAARASYEYVMNDGKVPTKQPQQPAAQKAPAGPPNTTLMQRPDGKKLWIPNDKVDAATTQGKYKAL